jgi:hypothetical protein
MTAAALRVLHAVAHRALTSTQPWTWQCALDHLDRSP